MSRRLFGLTFIAILCFVNLAIAQNLSLKPIITSGLNQPLYLTSAPGDDRLFIVEKGGAVRVYDPGVGLLPTSYLNIPVSSGGERGLLGLAFDPDFATNQRFFTYYTSPGGEFSPPTATGDIVVSRYTAANSTSNVAAPTNVTKLLTIPHSSQSNHNGGWMGFSPNNPDHLYIAVGDGGGSNDPNNNGQNTNVLLGKMLRIDVSGATYTSPSTNPFAGATAGADEIWHYGLRNPWRNSFDRDTGNLWIGDVGQDAVEEVNFQAAASAGGLNFGWDLAEGNSANPAFTNPIHTATHASGAGSITGGYVYRGDDIPGFEGQYIFGDYVSGQIFTLTYNGTSISGLTNRTSQLTPVGGGNFAFDLVSFGEDSSGELYLIDFDGVIYQIVPEPTSLAFTSLTAFIVYAWRARRVRSAKR